MQSSSSSPAWWLGAYCTVRALSLFVPWLIHLTLADLLLSALLPFKYVFPCWTYHAASAIAGSVWDGIQHICVSRNGARISISGDLIPPNESAIVVSNHAAWCDFYLIQQISQNAGMLSRCRWFAKKTLRYVPFLGWGLWTMGMPLVSRKWTQDQKEMERLFRLMKREALPVWLISYSEGTRYTPAKYAETVKWCEANGRPTPKHVLYPRTKGFVSTVQHLRNSHVKAVYDVTIAYAKGREFMTMPSFWQTLYQPDLGQKYRMHVHVQRYDMSSLPKTDVELALWLERRWIEKGEYLDTLEKELKGGHLW